MGIVQNYAQGRSIRAQMALTTPAQFADPAQAVWAAADSFRVLEGYELTSEEAREPRIDASQNRGLRQRLRRKTTTGLSFSTYIPLMGANGTPEMREALIAAMGAENVVGTTTTYSLTDVLQAMNFAFESEAAVGEYVYGAVVDTFRINFPSGDEPRFEFECQAKSSSQVGAADISGAVDGSGTPVGTVTLSTAINAGGFELDGFVTISGDLATSGPHRVNAINTGAGVVGFTPTVTTNLGTTVRIIPFTSYSESVFPNYDLVFPGFSGDSELQINGSVIEYQSATIEVANNFEVIDPAGTRTPADFCRGRRFVTGEIEFYGSEAAIIRKILANNATDPTTGTSFTSVNFALGRGLVGDPRMRAETPRVQFERSSLDLSGEGVATFSMPFTALGPADPSLADNELEVIFDVV